MVRKKRKESAAVIVNFEFCLEKKPKATKQNNINAITFKQSPIQKHVSGSFPSVAGR